MFSRILVVLLNFIFLFQNNIIFILEDEELLVEYLVDKQNNKWYKMHIPKEVLKIKYVKEIIIIINAFTEEIRKRKNRK